MEPLNIVITDCDHESTAIEEEAAGRYLAAVRRAQCRTEDEVIAAAQGADGIVVQYAPVTDRVLAALPSLKAVGRYGVGVDTVDVEAATRRGVAVCNVPDYGIEDVSDHALALALSVARGIVQLDRGMRRGVSALAPVEPLHRTATRVFGVVGLGLIGSATARKARGVGYTVIGCDPLQEPGSVSPDGVPVVTFEELLAAADVVSLHVPLNPATHHLMDTDTLSLMKPTAMLVNTCRGGVVDTDALVRALQDGTIQSAALDVFEEEPLPLDSPLMDCENVVLTPHAAWYSEESYAELKRRTIENVLDVCSGATPRNILNPGVLATGAPEGAAPAAAGSVDGRLQ